MTKANLDNQLDLVFHALSDRTRRAILERLTKEESQVTELAKPFRMSLNAVSKHLKVLERAGLINRTKDGRVHRCRMNFTPMEPALNLISHYKAFWESQLDGLEAYLKDSMSKSKGKKND